MISIERRTSKDGEAPTNLSEECPNLGLLVNRGASEGTVSEPSVIPMPHTRSAQKKTASYE